MRNLKTVNAVIFWNVLIFLVLVLTLVFFPTYMGAEDYVLSYGLYITVLIVFYTVLCLVIGIFFSLTGRPRTAQGFYLSAFTIAMIGVPSCYGGIFLRAAVI